MLVLKFTLFLASFFGWQYMFVSKWKLRFEFAPFMYCAVTATAMLAAGILNVMPEVAKALYVVGFVFIAAALKNKFKPQKRDIVLAFLFCAAALYFALLLRGVIFTHIDNYTHWGRVVKSMLLTDRMPNFLDVLIRRFQAYPLGSSVFIYFVCLFVGTSEACYLWAQAFMLISCLFTLAAFVNGKNITFAAIPLLAGVYCLVCNVSFYDLLVDTLIALAGAALFALVYFYGDAPDRAARFFVCPSIWLVNIKNSGAFFWLVCVLFLLVCAVRRGKKRRPVKDKASGEIYLVSEPSRLSALLKSVALGLVPAAGSIFLWHKHVALVFADGLTSQHAMTLVNYKTVLAGKSYADVVKITDVFLDKTLSFQNICVWLLLIIFVGIILLWFVIGKKKGKREAGKYFLVALGFAAVAILYQAGLLGMYIISMSKGGALALEAYDRYNQTMIPFVWTIFTVWIMTELSALGVPKGKVQKSLAVLLILLFVIPLYGVRLRLPYLYKYDVTKADWHELDAYWSEIYGRFRRITHGVAPGKRYLLCAKAYAGTLCRYIFWSNSVNSVWGDLGKIDFDSLPNDYDYIIIFDYSRNFTDKLKAAGYDVKGTKPQVIVLQKGKAAQ